MQVVANNLGMQDFALQKAKNSLSAKEKNNEELMRAAKEFVGVFMHQLLQTSQPEIDSENPFYAGGSEETFRSLYNMELGKQIADKFMPDLVNQIYNSLVGTNSYQANVNNVSNKENLLEVNI
jgi:hypothetical protein